MKPLCLSIGGLDPSAGAGILLDIKVFSELEVHGFAVASVLTAQSTDKVYDSCTVEDSIFLEQFKRIFENYQINAIKIGLITATQIALLLELEDFHAIPHRIVDPIISSSSGHRFIEGKELMPLLGASTLVLPNYLEALDLLGISQDHSLTEEQIAIHLREALMCQAVLLKGGHLNTATDILSTRDGITKDIIGTVARSSMEVHGTGCLLSSAITAYLSRGFDLKAAITQAKKYLSQKLDEAHKITRDRKYRFSFE